MERWSLKNKYTLITGGSKGIGLGIAMEFLELGAYVAIAARNETELKAIKTLYSGYGDHLEIFKADVSKLSDLNDLVNSIKKKWNLLDILVNNVGTNIRKPVTEFTGEEYDHIISTNLRSVYELSRLSFPLLKQSKQGNIINISSVAGLSHLKTGALYGMTKAAIIQFTKNLAVEWSEYGIRVNAIAPWYINTPLAEQVLKNPDYKNEVISRTPLGKIGNIEDVAGAAAFLCMPAAAYITGQCLAVDGGFTINGF